MERTFSLTFLPTHLAPPRVASLQSLDPPRHPPGLGTAASPTSTSAASSQICWSRSPTSDPPCLCWMLPHLPDFSLLLAPSTPPFTPSVHPPRLFLGIPIYLVPLNSAVSLSLFTCLCVVSSMSFILFPLSPPLLLLLNPLLSVPANFPLFFYISLIVLGSLFLFPFISLCRW